MHIDLEGNVFQGPSRLGAIKLAHFPAQERLERDRAGYWRAPLGLVPGESEAQVHQGALEPLQRQRRR